MLKRNYNSEDSSAIVLKKVKLSEVDIYRDESALISIGNTKQDLSLISLQQKSQRTSNLSAPNMLLSGHESAIYSICFDSTGKSLCSGSMDSNICENSCTSKKIFNEKLIFFIYQFYGMYMVNAKITTSCPDTRMQF